jgi:cytochrome c-type biogenesis protein
VSADKLTYAFAVGMAAAINPCGFALLPAYLAYYLGLDDVAAGERQPPSTGEALLRAVWVSLSLTAGFVVVFGVIGVFWSSISSVVGDRLPWVTVVVGIAVAILGVAMLLGFEPVVRLPRLQVGKGGQQAWSVFVFGISYGIASLGCTIPLFTVAMSGTFSESFWGGVATFLAYACGMGALIALLTIAVALARQGFVRGLRRLLPHMGRISGALLVLAGLLVAYAGWSESEQLAARDRGTALFDTMSRWQSNVSNWVQDVGPGRLGAIAAVVIVAVVTIALVLRHGSTRPASDDGAGVGTDAVDNSDTDEPDVGAGAAEARAESRR